jgi:hypothetical protein
MKDQSCVSYQLVELLDMHGYSTGEEQIAYDTSNGRFTRFLKKLKENNKIIFKIQLYAV